MKFIVLEFLTQLSNRPLLWVFAFAIPISVLLFFCLVFPRLGNVHNRLAQWINGVNVIVLGGCIAICISYTTMPAFLDHLEPTIANTSWLFWSGKPVYHDMQTSERYNLLYGPYLFMINGAAQGLFGPSVQASKLASCASLLLAVAVLYRVIQRRVSHSVALAVVGAWVGLMFSFTNPPPYYARADALLIACVTAGLAAARSNSWAGAAILGAACGVGVNLKLHAVAYFVPIAVVARAAGYPTPRMVAAIGVAACVALLPFVACPNVSIRNYGLTLGQAATHGFDVLEFRRVVEWLIVMVVPTVGGVLVSSAADGDTTKRVLRENKWLIASVCISALCIAVPASKYGSGPHHWLPFMPSLVWLTVELHRAGMVVEWRRTAVHTVVGVLVASWAVSLYATCAYQMYRNGQRCTNAPRDVAKAIEQDVRFIAEQYGANSLLLFGVGDDYQSYTKTFYRSLLVFQGMPIGIDPAALMEFKRARIASPSMRDLIADIRAQNPGKEGVLWILPKGAKPFEMQTFYPPNDHLYDRNFQVEFAEGWRLCGESAFYEIYALNGDKTAERLD